MTLEIKDLMPGDIIFDLDYSNNAEHASIFKGFVEIQSLGEEPKKIPQIVHAATGRHNCVTTTNLKEGNYRVVRYTKDPVLATRALYRMMSWSNSRIPYDHRRAELAMSIADIRECSHPRTGVDEQKRYTEQRYLEKFYSIVKYASRVSQGLSPVRIISEGQQRGLRCSQAVILAYQIEDVISAKTLRIPKTTHPTWLSDKYCNADRFYEHIGSTLGRSEALEFIEYQAKLNLRDELPGVSQNKLDLHPHNMAPGIYYWDSKTNIRDFFTSDNRPIKVDAKTSTSAALDVHLSSKSGWEVIGNLEVAPTVFTEEQKVRWRRTFAAIIEKARQIRASESQRMEEHTGSDEIARPCTPEPSIQDVKKTFRTPQHPENLSGTVRVRTDEVEHFCTPFRDSKRHCGSDTSSLSLNFAPLSDDIGGASILGSNEQELPPSPLHFGFDSRIARSFSTLNVDTASDMSSTHAGPFSAGTSEMERNDRKLSMMQSHKNSRL